MSPFISRYCFQLSSRLTYGLSWKIHVDFWQLAGFLFSNQHATILWLAYEALFEASLYPSKHLGQHQRPHIIGGQSSTVRHCKFWHHLSFSLFPFPLFSRGLASLQQCWRRRIASRGEGEEEEPASLPAFVSIMCHGRSWLSCSVWLSLLLQQSLFPRWKSVSLRGRRRSLLCIHFSSAQRSWALLSPCWHQLLSRHLSAAWDQLADRQLSIWIKQERTHTVLWVNITAYFSNTFAIPTSFI